MRAPMSETAISVAMATYNGERFLREQLESLARQSLLPAELIVCDDGSTDGTLEILREFAASAPFRVEIHRNETRLGFGFNSLGAISRCNGELVALCDQDDVWNEQKLRVCANRMRDPGIALVSHSARVFSSGPLPRYWRNPDHRLCVWSDCRDIPALHWAVLGFSIVLRRAVLERAPVPEYRAAFSGGCAHDVWATIAALSYGQVVLLPDELASYRLHEENVTLRLSAAPRTRLAPDPSRLERGTKDNARLAEFLRYAASFCDEPARGTFGEYIRQVERIGSLCGERAQLHRVCGHRWTAIRTLAEMLAMGDYAPRGLGAKALVRDALLAAFWRPVHEDQRG
jgi:glycosyltransferase involved in cell wall biosynthesis